ncbi:TPA: PorV/PorQ family protein [bacterium]|nr:PorV/PorQ family protein [bacterium]
MPKHTIALLLIIGILILSMNAFSATLEPKVGVRPMGMSAFSAVADDINATSWNPAGLALMLNQEAVMAYSPVYGDADIVQSNLAYAYPSGKWGTFALDFSYLNYGNMDWRDSLGKDLGSFNRKDNSIYLSYGVNLIDALSVGIALGTTSIAMNPMKESSNGLGFDLGALYNIKSKASVALYIENIGGVSADDREIARQRLRLGTAYSVINKPNMGLTLALDIDEQQKKFDTLYFGAEWSAFSPSTFFAKRKIQERYITLQKYEGIADFAEGLPEKKGKISLLVRGGLQKRLAVDEPVGFSGGFSIRYAIMPKLSAKFEHAFDLHPYLDTTQRFSIGLEMGKMVYE